MTTTAFSELRTPKCMFCGADALIRVETSKLVAYATTGALIQEVWPEKTREEREQIKTGIHPECWAKNFG